MDHLLLGFDGTPLDLVAVTGGVLCEEPDGSTGRAACLTWAELADTRLVGMLRQAVEIAVGEQG